MIKQVLALGLGIVAVTQEEFEKVKEAQKFKFLNCTLRGVSLLTGYPEKTYMHQR